MKPKMLIPISIVLAVLLLSTGLTWGMSETFCSYQHRQGIQFNLTFLIQGNQTSWHIQAKPVGSAPRPVTVIVPPAPAPERIPIPISFPRAMIKQAHQGTRVLGLLARVSARLMKRWLESHVDILKPVGSN